MKQKSVEFLLQELKDIGALNLSGLHWSDRDDAEKAIKEAKEMEKKNVIDAYNQDLYACLNGDKKFDSGEHYYNETFNK